MVNGWELGGGSIRIHNPSLQWHILTKILKVDPDQFFHLLKGLSSGCPPHGGIALGKDYLQHHSFSLFLLYSLFLLCPTAYCPFFVLFRIWSADSCTLWGWELKGCHRFSQDPHRQGPASGCSCWARKQGPARLPSLDTERAACMILACACSLHKFFYVMQWLSRVTLRWSFQLGSLSRYFFFVEWTLDMVVSWLDRYMYSL